MANPIGGEISTTVEVTHQRILHRVPPDLRENKSHLYDPVIVSLGPYHHGKPQLRRAEEIKDEVLNAISDPSAGVYCQGLNQILERVAEIRNFYGGVSSDEYDNEALAKMMLRDACFVLDLMDMVVGDENKHAYIVDRLGQSAVAFICGDLLLLENQIPFWIINLLISLTPGRDTTLIYNFLSIMNFGGERLKRVPWDDEQEQPLHLLEAHCIAFIRKGRLPKNRRSRRRLSGMSGYPKCPVTELKAKGILFRPTSCLEDIRFTSGVVLGELHVPVLFVNTNTKVFLSNAIALEMSRANNNSPMISSYVNFMKSFIMKPEDVQELREWDILVNYLGNDKNVVKMFEEISIDGTNNGNIFEDVHIQIRMQCHKVGTRMFQTVNDNYTMILPSISILLSLFALLIALGQPGSAPSQNHGKQN